MLKNKNFSNQIRYKEMAERSREAYLTYVGTVGEVIDEVDELISKIRGA